MDLPISEAPLSEQPRRFACDRCRGQKLRCERLSLTSSAEDVCRRCLRAGARCITTTSHRLNTVRRPSGGNASSTFSLNRPTSLDIPALDGYISPGHRERSRSPQVTRKSQSTDIEHRVNTKSPDDSLFINPISQSVLLEAPPAPLTSHQHEIACSVDLPIQAPASPISAADFFDFTQAVSSWPTEDDLEPPFAVNFPKSVSPTSGFAALAGSSVSRHRSQPQSRFSQCIRSSPKDPENWKQRFSRMSAVFLEDLNLVESGRVAGTLLLSTPPCRPQSEISSSSTSRYLSTSQNGRPLYAIGQMLKSADELIHALQELRGRSRGGDGRPPRGSNSSRGTGALESAVQVAIAGESYDRPDGKCVDALLALLILTCYTTFLRICRGVFSIIRDSLPVADAGASFEPVLPTIQLDGFEVVRRKTLQIRILLQVSAHLIGQIDEAMRAVQLSADSEDMPRELRGVLLTLNSGDGMSCDSRVVRESLVEISRSIQEKLHDDEDLW